MGIVDVIYTLLLPGAQLMEWAAYVIRKAEVEINCLVRLLLFANIKHSLAVSDAVRPVRLKVKVAVLCFLQFGVCLWMASFVTNYLTLLSTMFLRKSSPLHPSTLTPPPRCTPHTSGGCGLHCPTGVLSVPVSDRHPPWLRPLQARSCHQEVECQDQI